MEVSEEFLHDLTITQSARYKLFDRWRKTNEVYSSTSDRKRRDIFPVTAYEQDLPETVPVRYNGKNYKASLGFREGFNSVSIPVYSFYVDNRYYGKD